MTLASDTFRYQLLQPPELAIVKAFSELAFAQSVLAGRIAAKGALQKVLARRAT